MFGYDFGVFHSEHLGIAPVAANVASEAIVGVDAYHGGTERAECIPLSPESHGAAETRDGEEWLFSAGDGAGALFKCIFGVASYTRCDSRVGRLLVGKHGLYGGEVDGFIFDAACLHFFLEDDGAAQCGGGSFGAAQMYVASFIAEHGAGDSKFVEFSLCSFRGRSKLFI